MINQADTTKAILTQYADGPALLDSALAGLAETDIDLTLSADAWSIRQIVHHLVDGDDIWKTCIKTALGNSDALFSLQWYTAKPQMEWSESWAYARRDLNSSLALFRANRRHIVDLLEMRRHHLHAVFPGIRLSRRIPAPLAPGSSPGARSCESGSTS